MFNIEDIHSLSDFQRNTKDFVKHLQESHKPAVLTVNGKATLVVQEASAYQALIHDFETDQSAMLLRQRIERFVEDGVELDAGESLETLRGELGIPG